MWLGVLALSTLILLSVIPALVQVPLVDSAAHKSTSTTMTTSSASSGATTFETAISPQYSYAEDVQQTSEGGYVVGANFCSSTCYIALVAKLDSSGNLQWQKQYQPSGSTTQLYALRLTSDGGYVWAGNLQNSGACSECAFVAKLDSSGGIQWQKSYGSGAQANDIQQTTDGGYVIAGYTPPSLYGIVQAWIAKLDSSGNVQWQKALGSSNSVYGYSMQQTTDGGYVLAGFSGSPPNVLVAKFDSSGNVKWQTLYSISGSQGIGYTVIQTSDGGYMVGGIVNYANALALKLSSSGNVQWAKTYDVSGAISQFDSVRQTSDGGYAFSGYYNTGAAYGSYNSWVVRIDSNGNVQWQKTYGATTQSRQFQKIGLTSDGGFVAAGWTLQFNNQLETYIVKTDSAGNVNNCKDVQSTSAITATASLSSSSARLSISAPTNAAVSGMATASSTSFILTKEC